MSAVGWRILGAIGLVALALAAPLFVPNDYVMGVMTRICLYALLALGLNIVVGFAGLLDLGYVAFFGIGSYVYAFLASPHFGIHLPFIVILPIISENSTSATSALIRAFLKMNATSGPREASVGSGAGAVTRAPVKLFQLRAGPTGRWGGKSAR